VKEIVALALLYARAVPTSEPDTEAGAYGTSLLEEETTPEIAIS
jgi:hypothetical protein